MIVNKYRKTKKYDNIILGDELQAHHQSLPTRILDRWSVLPYNRECYLTY
jgi:hypothetical protein